MYGKPLNLTIQVGKKYPELAIAAEFKRASPSKGNINIDLDAVTQCLEYADAGATIISVLTEFLHFKGTLSDLKKVRISTQNIHKENRPAILRKDFILDRYQILEARANGADTVLLIVAILGRNQLYDLLQFSRSLGMEPLVEVHTEEEMEIALDLNCRVIGVNNRNLHTFKLDLKTTANAINVAKKRNLKLKYTIDEKLKCITPPDVIIASLSGITSHQDIKSFQDDGVSCILVGEALMKSSNPKLAISQLLNRDKLEFSTNIKKVIKVCGMKKSQDVSVALETGANMIGLIFAKSVRQISKEDAKEIVNVVWKYGERSSSVDFTNEMNELIQTSTTSWYKNMAELIKIKSIRKPLVVGVFQNHSPDYINSMIEEIPVDIVQLHGDETPDFIDKINVPCIKVLHLPPVTLKDDPTNIISYLTKQAKDFEGKAIALLIDSRIPGTAGGGTGLTFDWTIMNKLNFGPVILSGGLTPSNIADALSIDNVFGIDVSSGVESSPGVKDLSLIKEFCNKAK